MTFPHPGISSSGESCTANKGTPAASSPTSCVSTVTRYDTLKGHTVYTATWTGRGVDAGTWDRGLLTSAWRNTASNGEKADCQRGPSGGALEHWQGSGWHPPEVLAMGLFRRGTGRAAGNPSRQRPRSRMWHSSKCTGHRSAVVPGHRPQGALKPRANVPPA